jgi:hypothetical protein
MSVRLRDRRVLSDVAGAGRQCKSDLLLFAELLFHRCHLLRVSSPCETSRSQERAECEHICRNLCPCPHILPSVVWFLGFLDEERKAAAPSQLPKNYCLETRTSFWLTNSFMPSSESSGDKGTGRYEKIDLETWSNFGLEKNRARMPCKRLAGLRHTLRLRQNFSQIDFFTSSGRNYPQRNLPVGEKS